MKVNYVFEEQYYLISNKTVPRTPLFTKDKMNAYFLTKVDFYLSEVAEVCKYVLLDDEFHLLIKTKDRKTFIDFYRRKYKDYSTDDFFIKKSCYIFSQQMSNLQVSIVKYANHNFGRSGTMMDGRYRKVLITSKEELDEIETFLASQKKMDKRRKRWRHKEKSKVKHSLLKSSVEMYGVGSEGRVHPWLLFSFRHLNEDELRGYFLKRMKIYLIPPKYRDLIKILRFNNVNINLKN